MIDYRTRFRNYVKSVSSGKRECCNFERLAVQRHLNDLKNPKYYFDEAAGLNFCNFFKLLRHFKGEKATQEFILDPWQIFCTMMIFGWKVRKTGYRRFRYADVIIPRKNGKSTYAAGLALACMMIDGEMGAEIYSAGTDREQASVVWGTAKTMAEKSPAIAQFLWIGKKAIAMESTASSFKPLSRELKNKDGSNPHMAVCDERHAWTSNEMFEVLKSGLGARRQALIFTITTAGRDVSVPYFKQMEYLADILRGKIQQDNQFVMIFAPDEGDDWREPSTWRKVNPGIGTACSLDYIRDECAEAIKKGGSIEANFKTKNLNIWVNAPDIWISDDAVRACAYGTDRAQLVGKKCYAGLDIASHVDINALALFFPEEPHHPVLMHYWLPEAKINDPDRKDVVDYWQWAQQGWIHSMPGNMLDTDMMAADIAKILRQYNIQNLSFDPYKAYHGIIQNLQKDGLGEILDEFSQGIKTMSEPTKRVEGMVVGGEMDLMGDPVLRWMFGNVVLYRDPNDNIKIHKGKSRNKIDGVAALINAVGGWMSKTADEAGNLIYTSHTLRTVRI
jgi:phage terminase large subunit-like protein